MVVPVSQVKIDAANVVAGLRGPFVTSRGPHGDEPVRVPQLRHVGRKVGGEEHGDPRRLCHQLVELSLRKYVKKGVVLGLRRRTVLPVSEQRPNAEDVTVVADVDEDVHAIDALTDLDFAFHQNVELGAGHAALLEDDLPGLQVPNANPLGNAFEELTIEPIERGVLGQAVRHGQNHGIGRHARYLSKARSTISETSFEIPGWHAIRSSSACIRALRPGS